MEHILSMQTNFVILRILNKQQHRDKFIKVVSNRHACASQKQKWYSDPFT